MIKIFTIVGARPQFIKAAALSRELKSHSENVDEIILHTGQHYDNNMSKIFFDELNIPTPEISLETGGKNHGEMTGLQLIEIEKSLILHKPDLVVVYGDTNSTLAGALAASKLHIPIAHIEAGLRSFNRRMPEEVNRVLTDQISSMLFCPSNLSHNNLINEGISQERVHIVGDIMFDAVKYYTNGLDSESRISKWNLHMNGYYLMTIHREFITQNPIILQNLFKILKSINEIFFFPIHPRTLNVIRSNNIVVSSNVILSEPVGYLDMLALQLGSIKIITDSGGLQKEAFFNKKSCIVLRNETEWVELIEQGYNSLVKINKNAISEAIYSDTSKLDFNKNIYGDGKTSENIYNILSV